MASFPRSDRGLIEFQPAYDERRDRCRASAALGDRAPDATLKFARQLLAARRDRSRTLDGLSLGEPDWDILLDAFVAAGSDRVLPVSSLCIVAHTSVSTALRHINALVDAGYLRRSRDRTDQRRSLVALTEIGDAKLRRCLRDMMAKVGAAY